MYDLFDELKGDHSRIDAKKPNKKKAFVLDKELIEKLQDAELKLEKLD